jgi:hypothetical protein
MINKKIELFEKVLNNNPTSFEQVVYSEAIILLNNEVNPDKVHHWVSLMINTFNEKPKPLSAKEIVKIEERKQRKIEKSNQLSLINEKLTKLFDEYQVLFIGFFDWKSVDEREYDFLMNLIRNKGINLSDRGDGAYHPFISKKPLDSNFIKKFENLEEEICELSNKTTILDNYMIYDWSVFRTKIGELI